MNKEYLLNVIRIRIKELESKYREYFNTDTGPSKTYYGSACMRSRIKKDLGTLQLIEYLLLYCPNSMTISNNDLCKTVDRLTKS